MTSLRRALMIIGREHRGRFAILLTFSLLASGFEVVGAALVYLLLTLISDPSAPVVVPFIGDLGEMLRVDQRTLILGVVAGLAGFLVVRSGFAIVDNYVRGRIVQRMAARLSTRLFAGYIAMPYSFHLQRSSPDLIRNTHQVIRELAITLVGTFVNVLAQMALLVGMLVLMLNVDWSATLLAIGIIAVAALIVNFLIQPRLIALGAVAHREKLVSLRVLQQSLNGIRDVKLLNVERAFRSHYQQSVDRSAHASFIKSVLGSLPGLIIEMALLGFILVLFATAVLQGDDARSTLPLLGLFAYAGRRMQPAITTLVSAVNTLRFSDAPLEDLDHDLNLVRSVKFPKDSDVTLPLTEGLRLEGVSFRYETGHADALRDVDLEIRPGEIIGICGPTGGGKTTLVDLVTGLLAPTAGRITVDGVDIVGHERAWQRSLGVVPQMVFLTDDTLRNNIAFGLEPEAIDESAVTDAVDLAQLRTFIDSLPDGLDTVVGERGVRLSGGQRQRIAIARALYRRPSVLILDEGTSALDNLTEQELMEALAGLRGTHTIIMVAHRLSTVRDADRVVLVEGARISAIGTYDELLEANEGFRRLARA